MVKKRRLYIFAQSPFPAAIHMSFIHRNLKKTVDMARYLLIISSHVKGLLKSKEVWNGYDEFSGRF